VLLFLSISAISALQGQEQPGRESRRKPRANIQNQKDTLVQKPDTADAVVPDSTFADNEAESGIDAEVEYKADGYITLSNSNNKVYMYKNAQVNYKDIELKADYIELNRDSNTVYAIGKPDSTGTIAGKPIFKQGDQEFEADEIRYNFKPKGDYYRCGNRTGGRVYP
jgi:hypothetical protein